MPRISSVEDEPTCPKDKWGMEMVAGDLISWRSEMRYHRVLGPWKPYDNGAWQADVRSGTVAADKHGAPAYILAGYKQHWEVVARGKPEDPPPAPDWQPQRDTAGRPLIGGAAIPPLKDLSNFFHSVPPPTPHYPPEPCFAPLPPPCSFERFQEMAKEQAARLCPSAVVLCDKARFRARDFYLLLIEGYGVKTEMLCPASGHTEEEITGMVAAAFNEFLRKVGAEVCATDATRRRSPCPSSAR